MKKYILIILLFSIQKSSFAQALNPERVTKIKNATVLISIEGTGVTGTGFFINNTGTILTCWHVVYTALDFDPVKKVPVLSKIIAQFNDGKKIEYGMESVFVLDSTFNTQVVGCDFAILKPKSQVSTSFLKLGSFANAKEGEEIYTSGYPLSQSNQFISKGIISTKYIDTTITVTSSSGKVYNLSRNQALLDITLNSGNSGGAIIKMGKTIEDDEVIGISDFIITPIWPYYTELTKMFETSVKSGATGFVGGINPVTIFSLFTKILASSSVGISGCVSIDEVKKIMKWN